jgi:1-deoxy-D-xylulose-5-phosphate synthase
LVELAAENQKVVAITGAMPSGTGTSAFAKAYPERFFDVGIAEGHAVTFAAGLATQGIRPVCAIYSTFLQRAYDNVIHDVAIQHLPVIFAMDRAGVVGEDGPTHMGLYDIAYMLAVPGMVVTAPMNGREMIALLRSALRHSDGPFCLRYPRDSTPDVVPPAGEIEAVPHASWDVLRRSASAGRDPDHAVAILAVGTMVIPSLAAADILNDSGASVTVVNCRYLKPHDPRVLAEIVRDHRNILVVEEGTIVNGFGAHMASAIGEMDVSIKVVAHGVADDFVDQAPRAKQLARLGLDARGIAQRASDAFGLENLRGTHLRAV